MRESLSLYIHIPFCKSKCYYCAFVSSVENEGTINKYVDNLIEEIKLRGKIYNAKYEVTTVYIGGGTPSSLNLGAIKQIMHAVYSYFTVRNDAEITIEINPNTITKEKIEEYMSVNINRFSLGLQAIQPRLLKLIGRTHIAQDFANAVKLLTSLGATNISADLMLGLPTQKTEDVIDSIEFVNALKVKHISAYILSIEDGTRFKDLIEHKLLTIPSEKQTIKLYNTCYNKLKELGYNRYEFSNFAKDGYKSKHNSVYWARKPYLGLGVSAHSFVDGFRMANTASLVCYDKYINKNEIPLSDKDKLTMQDAKEETIMLSLRLEDGLNLTDFETLFNENLLVTKNKEIESLVSSGFIIITSDNHLKATNQGFLVIDKIISILAL